jgi:hypothetical protein
MANTPAYKITESITTKSFFMKQASGTRLIKYFTTVSVDIVY